MVSNVESHVLIIHPSIFYTRLIHRSGRGGAGAHRARGGVHPGQIASPSQGHTETNDRAHSHSLLRSILESCMHMHVFGQWEEARVPTENPRIHGENMQTPPRWGSNPEPSRCKATVLTTTPPFHRAFPTEGNEMPVLGWC